MIFLQNFFETMKSKGFFKLNNQPKEYVSPFASVIPVMTEREFISEEIEKDCLKYVLNPDREPDYRRATTMSRDFLNRFFSGVPGVDLKDENVAFVLGNLHKSLNECNSRATLMPNYIKNNNLESLNNLMNFLNSSGILEVQETNHGPRHTVMRADFLYARANELKEAMYRTVNQKCIERLDANKVEDVFVGHYRFRDALKIVKFNGAEDGGWKVLSEKEKKKYKRLIKVLEREDLIEKYENILRLKVEKVLNVWLSSPAARNYQEIKPFVEELNKKYQEDLMLGMKSEDKKERSIASCEKKRDGRRISM